PLCRLDEVVASATREITMHFDFDLVSVTLARGRDRSNSAFNHRLIWLRQHVQRDCRSRSENDKDHIKGELFSHIVPIWRQRSLVSFPFHPFSGNCEAKLSKTSNFFRKRARISRLRTIPQMCAGIWRPAEPNLPCSRLRSQQTAMT